MSELELAKVKLIDTIGRYNLTASNIAKFQFSKHEENVFATMMVEFAQDLANSVSTGEKQFNLPFVINCTDLEPDFIEALNQLIDTQRKPTKKRF